MRFNPDLKELVPDDHLDAELGGSYHYEFEPKTYWDSLISYVLSDFISNPCPGLLKFDHFNVVMFLNHVVQGVSHS